MIKFNKILCFHYTKFIYINIGRWLSLPLVQTVYFDVGLNETYP